MVFIRMLNFAVGLNPEIILTAKFSRSSCMLLRLWDTNGGVVRAPNAISHSAQSHLTMATKDGAQIERHLMHVHSQKE